MTNSKIMDQDGFTFPLQQGLGRVCIPVGYFAAGSLETQVPVTSKGLRLHMLGETFSLEERSSSPVPIHVSPDPSHEYNTGDEIVMYDKVWKLSIDGAKHVKEETDTHRLEVQVTLTSLHGGGTLDPWRTLPIYLVDEHGHCLYSESESIIMGLDGIKVPPRLSGSKTITMRWSGYDPESLKLIIALWYNPNVYGALIQAPSFTLVNYAVVDLGLISSISTPK